MNNKKPELEEFFYLKPKLTFAMKLAASFALTYYAIMLAYHIVALVFYRYSIDFFYLGKQSIYQNQYIDIAALAGGLLLSLILVTSLILILCKKTSGKAIFVVVSFILIIYQLITTSIHPWMKYALEILMVLVITPIRIKKLKKMPILKKGTHSTTSENTGQESEQTAESKTGEEPVQTA